MNVHFSSEKDDWETPQDLFDLLNSEFHFTLDVCATDSSAKCDRYFTPKESALKLDWNYRNDNCWMNPPYGRQIGHWLAKAHATAHEGGLVVCLIPARTDTIWWWDYCTLADEIRFLKGRLKFSGTTVSAPFPSAVIVFDRGTIGRAEIERRPLMVSWWDWKEELRYLGERR